MLQDNGYPHKTILFSSYLCNPFAVSEAYSAFEWLNILLKRFNIILLTTTEEKESVDLYYKKHFPDNLEIISFPDNYPFKSYGKIKNTVRLGYFYFNYKITSYLKKRPEIIDRCDIILHKSPESFRHFTSLVKFDKPVYIGPLGGGLKVPAGMKDYFKKEHFLLKLRVLDKLLLKLPAYRNQFKKAEKVLLCLEYVRDTLPPEFLERSELLLNNGINCDQYPQAVGDTAVVAILFVGRLTRYKGAELLIKALSRVRSSNFVLNILGRGEEQAALEGLVKSYGLSDKIIFQGYKSIEETRQFYYMSSIFCLPTLTEAGGNVFFEAMASGLPIITIDNGGPKYICPDEGAIKIPVTSEEGIINDLQESLELLIGNQQKRKEMGKFNRGYCRDHYDWKVVEQNILRFFAGEIYKTQHLR
ncbi:glycosyltransferase family 4 protein [Mucilaginibacter sp.]|jgi:glycosyltransferase involved in cell wall biosynthesis|uniref:glycosyltransferase family 4 protein n=1 Tax=Mucilaginibacter sp. TaxID=1882438 RepID=UPI002BF12B23|nr:glycosyltransferase family 4 protein [Mucilaginibacter sp.]HTI61267.1 glycosyltransferase family 4 protein [Mucilaginibacter sp.]